MTRHLADLYQEVILDHNRRPRKSGVLPGATARALGRNPGCGDAVTVELKIQKHASEPQPVPGAEATEARGDAVIQEVRFTATGCAVSRASASIMSVAVRGQSVEAARGIMGRFVALITGAQVPTEAERQSLGDMAAFSGVSRFPARIKCAATPWNALAMALSAAGVLPGLVLTLGATVPAGLTSRARTGMSLRGHADPGSPVVESAMTSARRTAATAAWERRSSREASEASGATVVGGAPVPRVVPVGPPA